MTPLADHLCYEARRLKERRYLSLCELEALGERLGKIAERVAVLERQSLEALNRRLYEPDEVQVPFIAEGGG